MIYLQNNMADTHVNPNSEYCVHMKRHQYQWVSSDQQIAMLWDYAESLEEYNQRLEKRIGIIEAQMHDILNSTELSAPLK